MTTRHAIPTRSPAGPWLTVGTTGMAGLLAALVVSGSPPTVPARDALPVGGAGAAAGIGAFGSAAGAGATPSARVGAAAGVTVYRYGKDSAVPSRSACTGGCARTWPPLVDPGVPALARVPRDRIGTLRRADGARQVTLDGWPLYRFAKDVRPGDAKGDGVGGTWQAIDGTETTLAVVRTPAAAPTPAHSNPVSPGR